MLWISTSDLSNHHEISRDTSFSDMAEVDVVTQLLEWMEEDFQRVGESREIGVIAGYSGQIVTFTTVSSRRPQDRGNRSDIEIATVDAFQGQYRDVVDLLDCSVEPGWQTWLP